MVRGRKPREIIEATPVTVPAIEGVVNADRDRLRVFIAEVPAIIAAQFPSEPALDTEGGFQRGLDLKRAEKIGRLMSGDRDNQVLPEPNVHSALLAYANDEELTFADGKLTFHGMPHLFDGQHRSKGDAWAIEHGMVTDYTETVKFVVGATHQEVITWYLRTNVEAKNIPAPNAILNVANMTGTFLNRKSWIARIVRTLVMEEPFVNEDGVRLTKLESGDTGMFSLFTLYKATNLLLPDKLNQEGRETELAAIRYAHEAWSLYAELFGAAWGDMREDKFTQHDAYTSTMLLAFARLHRATEASGKGDAAIRKAWRAAGLNRGLPAHSTSSGDAAAVALAGFLAAQAGLKPEAIAA